MRYLGNLRRLAFHSAWCSAHEEGEDAEFLGTIFSNVKVKKGDKFTRPSAGEGGLGDSLEREPKDVLEDVIDGYVSIERAKKDYGVVIKEIDREIDLFEIDGEATEHAREYIRVNRKKWLEEDPDIVMGKYHRGELDLLDLIRHYGIMKKRSLGYWG